MPVFEFRCKTCDNIIETLIISYKDKSQFKVDNCCSLCEGGFEDVVSKPARTVSLWGDETGKYGVNGMYSQALGRTVTNKREEERICRKMGYVNTNDLPEDFVDSKIQSQLAEDAKYEKLNNAYKKKVVEYGSTYGGTMRAITEVLPAKEMLKEADQREAKT